MEGSIVLSIYGDTLDFLEIEKRLNLSPLRIVKKGKKIGKKTTSDGAFFEKEFNSINFTDICNNFLDTILLNSGDIKEVSLEKEVKITLYIRSEYGQIDVNLTPEIIEKLAKLSLDADIDILSFGDAL